MILMVSMIQNCLFYFFFTLHLSQRERENKREREREIFNDILIENPYNPFSRLPYIVYTDSILFCFDLIISLKNGR